MSVQKRSPAIAINADISPTTGEVHINNNGEALPKAVEDLCVGFLSELAKHRKAMLFGAGAALAISIMLDCGEKTSDTEKDSLGCINDSPVETSERGFANKADCEEDARKNCGCS